MDPSGYCHRKLAGRVPLAAARTRRVSRPSTGLLTVLLIPLSARNLTPSGVSRFALAPRSPHPQNCTGLILALLHARLTKAFMSLRCFVSISFQSFARFRLLASTYLLQLACFHSLLFISSFIPLALRSSPRPISIIKLNTLPCLHR